MSAIRLDTPFLDGGLRSTNYFNGRILSREDMQRDRDADRAIHERLGRALGPGIVSGFEVEANSIGGSSVQNPVVTIHAGLAVNRMGQTLALARDVDVALLKPTSIAPTASPLAGSFDACAPPEENVYVTGTGVYLLTAFPAQAKQGLALVSGLAGGGDTCNAKEIVDGIQFRLFPVKGLSNGEPALADEARLRNVAAYKFFLAEGAGTEAVRDPFGVAAAAPALTEPALTDCDVALALIHWTATGGLRFVDLWSVRRPLSPSPPTGASSLGLAERRSATALAMSLQFQDHLRALFRRFGAPLVASDNFRYLPPLGVVRLDGALGLGFFSRRDPQGSPVPLTVRGPVHLEGARVGPLLDRGLQYARIDLAASELVWLYFVRENKASVGPPAAVPFVIFASGQIPYLADSRFDVAKWDFGNYSLDCEASGL